MLDAHALRTILDTFGRDAFGGAVERAKRLLDLHGSPISPGRNSLPTSYVEGLGTLRASHDHISRSLAQQTENVARTAASVPAEHWYVHRIAHGAARIWIYVNEEGTGRVCIEFDPKVA